MTTVVTTVPTDHAVWGRDRYSLKTGLYGFSRVMNVKAKSRKRPSFMAKTHQITVSPRPPETGKEGGRTSTICIIFYLVMRTSFRKEIMGCESELTRIARREPVVTEAV
jgi:hypothetical protein